MKITGSIVTYNNARTIEKCIESVLKQTAGKDYDFKLYVYDNGSEDDTPMIIQKKYPEVTLVCSSQNRGFGYGHNAIIKKVKSDYHFVINPDIFMDRDAIGFLAKELEKDDTVGLATPKILNSDGTEQFLPKYCPTMSFQFSNADAMPREIQCPNTQIQLNTAELRRLSAFSVICISWERMNV